MDDTRHYTYYRFESVTGSHPAIFYRRWRGVTDRLDQDSMTWVPVSPDYLSHYLEDGEVGLDTTSQAAIESAIGQSLPD